MEAQAGREMPKYKSHKEVWALKIASIEFDWQAAKAENRETDGTAIIWPADEGFGSFRVDANFVRKHLVELDRGGKSIIGGYYVVYSDGYKSFSPAQAFEEGYTRA